MRRTVLVAVLSALLGAVVATPVAVYASHQYNDVPSSHNFHNAIAWFADQGITVGCNQSGTQFCPDDPVTRGQMAVFMKRLSENQVVDAATVQGLDAADLAGIQGYQIATETSELGPGTTSSFGTLTASCPGDLKVIGGGASALQPPGGLTSGYEILQEYPGSDESSWNALYSVNKASSITVEVTVYAICASV